MGKSFTAPAAAVASAVKYAARWLDPKPTTPVQGGLLFVADSPGSVAVAGMSENATARSSFAVEGDAPEAFVVAGRLIAALVDTFPKGPITFELEGTTIHVSSGRFRATLPTMSENDYPSLPGTAPAIGTVDGTDLADAVRRVAPAANPGAAQPGLQCVHLTFDGEDGATIGATATDTYRAARQRVDWRPEGSGTCLVFADVLGEAIDAFDAPESVTVGLGGGMFSLTTPMRSLVTRTVEAAHPVEDLERIFASAPPASFGLRSKDLTLPLKRADLLKGKESDAVRIDLTENLLTLSAGEQAGDGEEEIEIEYDGPESTMVVRSATLRGALESAPGDRVTVAFTPNSPKPLIVTSAADPTWRYLLVPLRNLGGK